MRATLVAVIYFAARALDHRTPPLNVLALSALLLGVARPLGVFDEGFLLTFAATFEILMGVPRAVDALRARWSDRPRLARVLMPVVGIGTATLCAEAALWPVAAWAFSRLSLAGFVLNVGAIPLMSVVQVAEAAASLGASVDETLARVPGYVAHLAAWALVESARFVDVVPWLVIRLPAPSLVLVCTYYASCVLWYRAQPATWMRRVVLGAAVGAAAWMAGANHLQIARDLLRVTVLDVGQGDAVLVQLPDGESISWTLLVPTRSTWRSEALRRRSGPATSHGSTS